MMKVLFNVAFLLLLVSTAGFLPGMNQALPLIGMTPVGVLSLGIVGWALYDLLVAPVLDGVKVEEEDGKPVSLSYTIQGKKALVVQLMASGWSRLFKAGKAKSKSKSKFEKKINLS
jgi:hypothetical protein